MADTTNKGITAEQVLAAYESTGSIRRAAEVLGISRGTVYYHLDKLGERTKPITGGRVKSVPLEVRSLPTKGEVQRYILSSVQNNTTLHEPTWKNLLALKKHFKAELMLSSYTYNSNAYGRLSVKVNTKKEADTELWYAPESLEYLADSNVELAPGLVWCGRMNTLPTAANPLSGFETYTGRKSGIFPHAKHTMQSVASGKHEPTKFNYTTGTTTKQNYIQKTAGIKAEHHHTYGALLVEVNTDGNWWVRQLQTDKNGRMFDLTVRAENGKIIKGPAVEAVTWGDLHAESTEPLLRDLYWGKRGVLDELKPKFQFVHDIIDFGPRNHHNIRDPHFRFKRYMNGKDHVETEMSEAVTLLHEMERINCRTVVVNSNHDNALTRWLREADYRTDPANAMFFLRCQLRQYEALSNNEEDFMILEHVLRELRCPKTAQFLHEDESFITCRDSEGGIENGNHGHLGPNGSRGSPRNLAKQGRRQNTGHTHTAGIIDGMFTAGTTSKLDLGYNKGPGAWSHTFIVTYTNGKRTLVTVFNGRHRA